MENVAVTDPELLITAEELSTPWNTATAVWSAVRKPLPAKSIVEESVKVALETVGEEAASCSNPQSAELMVFAHE